MLCSIDELSVTSNDFPGTDSSGILILSDDNNDISLDNVELGDDIRPVLGLDDSVAEFEITPNRPDCLSVIGLARETQPYSERPLNISRPTVKAGHGDISDYLEVEIESDLCSRYAARVVTDVKIEPSCLVAREIACKWSQTNQQYCRYHKLCNARVRSAHACVRLFMH